MNLPSGQRFGRLLVVEKTNQKDKWGRCYLYKCRCDCGGEVLVTSTMLKAGQVRSCGCLQAESRKLDVTGQTFGYLTAIRPTERVRDHSIIWQWRCICGKIVEARLDNVRFGNRKSCGCEGQKVKKQQAADMRGHVEWVDGTCVNRIRSKKLQSSNTSGVRGVSWHKRIGKWQARIMFRGHAYSLGYFSDIEAAKSARQQAEKMYFEEFLRWYDVEIKTSKSDAAKIRKAREGTTYHIDGGAVDADLEAASAENNPP